MAQDLFGGGWVEKLEALAAALRAVHKALIESTRREYESRHGRIQSPYALFALVAQDPAFAWIQPMTRAIVEIEDQLGPKAPPVLLADFRSAQEKVRRLVDPAGSPFGEAYWARIDADPDVAVEHGRLQIHLRAP
jgi:hypothetical protein